MFKNKAAVLGYVVLIVMLTAGTAQSLSGSNTVTTDDIVDGQIYNADLRNSSVTSPKIAASTIIGADVAANTLTGADIDESKLSPRTFFAQVSGSGGVVHASSGVAAEPVSTGVYRLTFPRSMSACSATANPAGFNGSGVPKPQMQAYVEVGYSSVLDTGDNDVSVKLTDDAGTVHNTSFTLIAVCP